MKRFIHYSLTAIILSLCILNNSCKPLPNLKYDQPPSSSEMRGAFGFRYGDILDKSEIIEEVRFMDPILDNAYKVRPRIKNRDIDTYYVVNCNRTKKIHTIVGVKHFNSKDQAMNYLQKVAPHIEQKYGPFAIPENLKGGSYRQCITKHSSSITCLIVMKSMDIPSMWEFGMVYSNEYFLRQCRFFLF